MMPAIDPEGRKYGHGGRTTRPLGSRVDICVPVHVNVEVAGPTKTIKQVVGKQR